MTTLKLKRTALTAFSLALAASLAATPTLAEAQKQRPKTTAASASPKKPNAQKGKVKGGSAGSTQGSATANPKRPNTNRNRAGYILKNPRKVTFKLPSKSQRKAASTRRRNARGNQTTQLGTATIDKRSAAQREALAAKQAQRGKPQVNPTSTAALREAAANGFKPTAASRGAIRAGAAPIGSGQVQNPTRRQWGELVAQTAQRKGLPEPKKGFFRRGFDKFMGLFSW